jgi:hypothetical protein
LLNVLRLEKACSAQSNLDISKNNLLFIINKSLFLLV